MKADRIANSFFWICNALTFSAAASFTLWWTFNLLNSLINNTAVQKPYVAFILFAYPGFVAWKTGNWLLQPNPGTALNYIWYWLIAIFLCFILGFILAATSCGGHI